MHVFKAMLSLAVLLVVGSFLLADEEGQMFLDQATEAKLNAKNFQDLEEVIKLAEKAVEAGLDEGGKEFAIQLITSTLYQRAEQLSNPLLSGRPPQQWVEMRRLALSDLGKLTKYNDQFADAHLLIAKLQALPGGTRKTGIESASKALELYEDDEQQANALIARAALRGDAGEKITDLTKAIEVDEDNSAAVTARAAVYSQQGDFEQAAKDFRRVLELDGDDVLAMSALAEALAQQKEFDQAIKIANQAVEKQPDASAGYELRARIHLMQNDIEEGKKDLDKAIEINPKSDGALLLRANVALAENRLEDANKDLDALQQINPNSPQLYLLRAGVLEQQGDYYRAAKLLEALLQFLPADNEMRIRVAMDYSMAEEFESAIKQINVAIERNKEDWIGYYSRADIYLSMGEHAKAVADYEKAYEYNQTHDNLLNNWAWTLATSDNEEVRNGKKSVELALKACEVSEYKKPHILSTLGAAYAETGDFENAKKWAKKAVEIGRDDIQEHLELELKSYEDGKPWRENKAKEREDKPPVDRSKLKTI
ncbi:MAG: hypothetical protein CMJ76_06600 [Planctomycetaceae bacterium]|nr:hypothetical protein [Planctomycetaceae bacterium]